MKQKIILFDGAMGTEIQKLNPKPEDFPDGKEGFNDGLSFTRPEWIKKIHRSYLQAGADCIETNTFGSNKLKLEEYGYGDQTLDYNKKIAQLAVDVAQEFTDKPRYVIGSMGPTGFLPSSNDPSLGQIKLDEIREAFEIQAEGLILGGVDALLIETSQDILEVKLAIEACHNAFEKTGKRVPIIANVTLDKYGKMLLGTNIQAAYTTVSEMGIDAFGLNCSTGPTEMIPAFGTTSNGNSSCSFNHCTLGIISVGPVEQFSPNASIPISDTVVYAAWMFVPRSIFPYLSNVMFAIIGTLLPVFLNAL